MSDKKTILIFAVAAILLFSGCHAPQPTGKETIYVSIRPLRWLVEAIVGEDFPIEVLVPDGASPETFEPTPRQFIGLNEACMVFSVGLIDFETALTSKITDTTRLMPLCRGILPIAGSCSHERHGRRHTHGVDPHVWTSPRELQIMAKNAYEAIHRAYPDSIKYEASYRALQDTLAALDREIAAHVTRSGVRSVVVYHPALTYYARAYGLEQIAVEDEGKEPSARRLSQLIRRARTDSVRRIFYQRQFPLSTVEVLARDIGAVPTEFDPLRGDVAHNLREITALIVSEP